MSRLEKANGFSVRGKESFININEMTEKLRLRLNDALEKKVCEAKKMLNVDLLPRYFMSPVQFSHHFSARTDSIPSAELLLTKLMVWKPSSFSIASRPSIQFWHVREKGWPRVRELKWKWKDWHDVRVCVRVRVLIWSTKVEKIVKHTSWNPGFTRARPTASKRPPVTSEVRFDHFRLY